MVEPDVSQRFGRADRALEALEQNLLEPEQLSQHSSLQNITSKLGWRKPQQERVFVRNTGRQLIITAVLPRNQSLSGFFNGFSAAFIPIGIIVSIVGIIIGASYPPLYPVFYLGNALILLSFVIHNFNNMCNCYISLDDKSYTTYQIRQSIPDRQRDFWSDSLQEIRDVFYEEVPLQLKSDLIARLSIVVFIRNHQTAIPFGMNLTRQEAELIVTELRNWISQHG